MIAANYAVVHKLDMFQLKKPIKLQMATSGSCSVTQYGAWAKLQVGELTQTHYFDVVNLDRYNAILGTPFLKEHKVILNFAGDGTFKLNDRWFPVKEPREDNIPKEGEGKLMPPKITHTKVKNKTQPQKTNQRAEVKTASGTRKFLKECKDRKCSEIQSTPE